MKQQLTREDGDGVSLITPSGDGSGAGLARPAAIELDLLEEEPIEWKSDWLFAQEEPSTPTTTRPFQSGPQQGHACKLTRGAHSDMMSAFKYFVRVCSGNSHAAAASHAGYFASAHKSL